MSLRSKLTTDDSSRAWLSRLLIRSLQFIMAVTVIGLYATDVAAASRLHVHQDPRWLYAVTIATLSALTSLIYLLPIPSSPFFGWDLTLFVLWTAQFGVFGKLYVHLANAEGDKGIARMKSAVWVDLVNMLLWLATGVYGFGIVLWGRSAERRTLHTGRARL